MASLSSSLVRRLEPRGEPGLLPGVRVPGTSVLSAGLMVTLEGSPALSRGYGCRPCLVAGGQMGRPSTSLESLPCSPSWWAHWQWIRFDRIRGTPCSTVATTIYISFFTKKIGMTFLEIGTKRECQNLLRRKLSTSRQNIGNSF